MKSFRIHTFKEWGGISMRDLRKLVVSGVVATSLVLGSGSVFAASFDDVSGMDSEMAITKLVSLGYIVNKGTEFHPESGLSRLEYADIANRIFNLGKPSTLKIKDLNTSGGQNVNAVKLVSGGFITLTKKGEFFPKKSVTYAELSKLLAYGLGFKQSWSNRPVDYLFFLERKGVLSIDTDLDANVTREEAAIAFDNYLNVKHLYNDKKGVIISSDSKSITLKTASGVNTFNLSTNSSIFVDNQASDTNGLGLGIEAKLIFDKSGKVAFVDGVGIDSAEGAISYSAGKVTVGSTIYNINLNAVIGSLPTNPTADFTFKQLTGYLGAGVSFGGSVFTNLNTDEITSIAPYISKVTDKAFKVDSSGKVVFDFSGDAQDNITISPDASTKVSLIQDGKTTDSTLAAISGLSSKDYKISGSAELANDGVVKSFTVKADKIPAPQPTK
jgi:hypothetical protein